MKVPQEKIKGEAQDGRKKTPHRDEGQLVKIIGDRAKESVGDPEDENGPVA